LTTSALIIPVFQSKLRMMSNENTNDPTPNPAPGRKQVVRPPGVHSPRDLSASVESAEQLTNLAHELSNMLDGSMRWLGLAAAALPKEEQSKSNNEIHKAREQIDTVQSTLERMSSMVNAALRSKSIGIGSPMLGVSDTVSIAMAIDHAVDVVRPHASQAGVRIEVRIEPNAGRSPAGPMYTVLLNGLFNAVQSIGRATKTDSLDPGGLIEIVAKLDKNRDEVVIEMKDDGVGISSDMRNNKAFAHGASTREDGHGMGLAISQQIIEQLEGLITLCVRDDRSDSLRPGAVLRISIPIQSSQDELIG
jgi:signal transduction histidine kinase